MNQPQPLHVVSPSEAQRLSHLPLPLPSYQAAQSHDHKIESLLSEIRNELVLARVASTDHRPGFRGFLIFLAAIAGAVFAGVFGYYSVLSYQISKTALDVSKFANVISAYNLCLSTQNKTASTDTFGIGDAGTGSCIQDLQFWANMTVTNTPIFPDTWSHLVETLAQQQRVFPSLGDSPWGTIAVSFSVMPIVLGVSCFVYEQWFHRAGK